METLRPGTSSSAFWSKLSPQGFTVQCGFVHRVDLCHSLPIITFYSAPPLPCLKWSLCKVIDKKTFETLGLKRGWGRRGGEVSASSLGRADSGGCPPHPHVSPMALLSDLYWQGHIMTCGGPRHLIFIGPFLHKKILKMIFYDCIGI